MPSPSQRRRARAAAEVVAVSHVVQPKPSVTELMAILDSEEAEQFEIRPNGEIVRHGDGPLHQKPLTMREDLGGEYASRKRVILAASDDYAVSLEGVITKSHVEDGILIVDEVEDVVEIRRSG